MKRVNFFSHDNNARNDEKLLRVRMDMGWKGVGLYWAIIEMMDNTEDGLLLADWKLLAVQLMSKDRNIVQQIARICTEFALFEFTDDKKKFFSASFLRRKEEVKRLSSIRSSAGKKGMESRYNDNKSITDEAQSDNISITKSNNINNSIDTIIKEKDIDKSISKKKNKKENDADVIIKEISDNCIIADNSNLKIFEGQDDAQNNAEKPPNVEKIEIKNFALKFQKSQKDENQKNRTDWNGNDEKRFCENLEIVVKEDSWKKLSARKYAVFIDEEKQDLKDEFILRNSKEAKYTGIYFDRDFQNNQRQHFINFLEKKLAEKQRNHKNQDNGTDGFDTKHVGSEYKTKFTTDL